MKPSLKRELEKEAKAARKRIKKYASIWALGIGDEIEDIAEEQDFNSYDFTQEFIRQLRHIWKRT